VQQGRKRGYAIRIWSLGRQGAKSETGPKGRFLYFDKGWNQISYGEREMNIQLVLTRFKRQDVSLYSMFKEEGVK